MRLGPSATALVIGTATVAIAVVTIVSAVFTGKLVEAAHDDSYLLMRQVYASILKSTEDKALSRAEIVEAIPSVHAAFLARDRQKLLAELKPMFNEQDEKYGLDQAGFHTPPGVYFLRLHKPEQFGDDQTSYRPMLADVHQTKSARKGISIGRNGVTINGIVPIVDETGKLQGSFEMGMEVPGMLDKIKEAYGIEASIYFEEKKLREVATGLGGDVLSPQNRVGRYIRFHATHPELAKELVTDADIEISEQKHFERSVKGVPWGVQLMPVYNYANKQIGVVALASSFAEDKAAARRARIWSILTAVFSIVIIAGVTTVTIRGKLSLPLRALSERMVALSEGDRTKPADPIDSYSDELVPIAEAYEKMRAIGGPPPAPAVPPAMGHPPGGGGYPPPAMGQPMQGQPMPQPMVGLAPPPSVAPSAPQGPGPSYPPPSGGPRQGS